MNKSKLFPSVCRDGKLVVAAATVRSLDYGFLSVFLGVYLSLLEFTAFQAGLVFSGIMAGGALSNAVAAWKGDAIGRRRMLVTMSVLMVVGGALMPLVPSVSLLMVVGLFAMTSSTGGDRTAFLSMDVAILAESTDSHHRTALFAWYDLLGFGAKAIGVLLITVPSLLQSRLGLEELSSFQAMFWIYALIAIVGIPLYARLSTSAEPRKVSAETRIRRPAGTRKRILQLASLFSLDSLGGGFMVNSFISFWFSSKFGTDVNTIAAIFFTGQLLNSASLLMAAPVARKIGLINTMVITQVLANLLMMAVPLTGNLWLAITFFLTRELANDLDVPTRQSYMMAIVPRDDRTAMASTTNLGRTLAQSVSPAMAGFIAQLTFLGAPFLIGSGTKLFYNALIYSIFRGVKPLEEKDS